MASMVLLLLLVLEFIRFENTMNNYDDNNNNSMLYLYIYKCDGWTVGM